MRTTKKVLIGLGAVPLVVGLLFLVGLVVQALWNWLMPAVFRLPAITYWQAWGILILAHILFGRHGARVRRGGSGRSFRDRVRQHVHPAQAPPPGAGNLPLGSDVRTR